MNQIQLARSDINAICHLIAVQRIELKPFKATTIEVAYAKRAMSNRLDGSQVHCTAHSSLWADLGAIMMDGVADLSSGSAELDFVNSTSHPVVIKPGQIVTIAMQVDSVEMLLDREQMMINQYHLLNLSSVILRERTNFCFLALCQVKQWTQKKKSLISIWI